MGSLLKVINSSTMLGFWDELGDGLLNLLVNTTVGPLLWSLCDIFFWILDIFEKVFRAFAGTLEGGVSLQGEKVEGDIVLYLTQSDLVMQIFNAILTLSIILLIIFTIFAIAKNQYAEKQEPVSKIINNSIKALLMYLLVPIATVVCLMVGNIVLQAIDGATKTQSRASASQMLFVTAAYNANKLRDSDLGDATNTLEIFYKLGSIARIEGKIKQATGITPDNVDTAITAEKMEIIASMVDEHFAAGDLNYTNNFAGKWNYGAVATYYDAFRMSYITVWIGGAFLIWAIGKICWGLVSRVFKMTLYFAISPAIMATFPIDGGKALGSWRGEMVKQGTMAFTAVGVLNVLYSILPAFNNLDIGTGIGGSIIKLFITIIAFSSAKDLVGAVSGWFGTGDAISEGIKAKSQYTAAKKKLSGAAMKGVGLYGAYRGGSKAAGDHGKNKFWGGMAGMLSSTPLGKAAFGEEFEKQQKAGAKSAEMFGTMATTGERRKQKQAEWNAYDERKNMQTQYKATYGEEFAGGYQLDDQATREVLEEHDKEEYERQEKLGKRILKIDDTGKKAYFREIKENEDEREKITKQQSYFRKVDEIRKKSDQYAEKEGAYQSKMADQFGVTDISTVDSRYIDAFLSGNMGELQRLQDQANAIGDTDAVLVLTNAMANMTDQMVTKLNDMKETYEQIGQDMVDEITKLDEDLVEDKDFQSFAERAGFVTEGGGTFKDATSSDTGMSALIETLKDTGTKLKESADKNAETAKDLNRQATAFSQRHMLGTMTDADRAKMKDYDDAHPKSS